jgi:F-type H+-transporting ATPase subunit b
MPQLEVSTFASQIFWLILCFSALYYLLSKKALPRVAEVLEARQNRIAADLDHAQKLRQDAETALADYEAVMAKAHDQAQSLLRDTQAKHQAETAERQAEIEAELGKQIAAAESRIADAKAEALKELDDAAVETAQSAVERLAGVKVTKKDAQAALKQLQKEAA